ncbi:hypothetical protein [Calycomorphotria hydatis]|uniref:Uncharacterized protein n=1 Tax=Calycomorphotria hydatis TaxID=2528027 RepID=A0A517TES8_9PLAN|nr:hypothetical protein [Calycomorphotria hydatis]QDT66876.1 hypothetical protein V22_41480 [Calycomorphotria hydatis]
MLSRLVMRTLITFFTAANASLMMGAEWEGDSLIPATLPNHTPVVDAELKLNFQYKFQAGGGCQWGERSRLQTVSAETCSLNSTMIENATILSRWLLREKSVDEHLLASLSELASMTANDVNHIVSQGQHIAIAMMDESPKNFAGRPPVVATRPAIAQPHLYEHLWRQIEDWNREIGKLVSNEIAYQWRLATGVQSDREVLRIAQPMKLNNVGRSGVRR